MVWFPKAVVLFILKMVYQNLIFWEQYTTMYYQAYTNYFIFINCSIHLLSTLMTTFFGVFAKPRGMGGGWVRTAPEISPNPLKSVLYIGEGVYCNFYRSPYKLGHP